MENRRLKRIISLALCLIICGVIIFSFGDTYTVKIPVGDDPPDPGELRIEIEDGDGSVVLENCSVSSGTLLLKFSSEKRGKSMVWVYAGEELITAFRLYVHSLGLITYDSFFGPCTGGIAVPFSLCLIMLSVFTGILKRYLTDMSEDMYRYGNVTELGLMIFCGFMFANLLRYTLDYGGPVSVARSVIASSEPQGRRLPLQRSKRERNARKCGVFSVFHIDFLYGI